jgi:hypothetical protein
MIKPSDKSDRRECREGWVACRAAWRIWLSKGARKLAERSREKMRWWAAARSQQSGALRPEPPERFGAAHCWAASSGEVETFLREYDEVKHPLSREDEAALEAAREDFDRRLRVIFGERPND